MWLTVACAAVWLCVAELSLPLSDCVALLRTVRCALDESAVAATAADELLGCSAPAASPAASRSSSPSAPQLAASLRSAGGPSPAPSRPWSTLATASSFSPHSALSLYPAAAGGSGSGSGGGSYGDRGSGRQPVLSPSSAEWSAPSNRSIFTLCQKLDWLLGDGVRLSELTEFCGVPGVGNGHNSHRQTHSHCQLRAAQPSSLHCVLSLYSAPLQVRVSWAFSWRWMWAFPPTWAAWMASVCTSTARAASWLRGRRRSLRGWPVTSPV